MKLIILVLMAYILLSKQFAISYHNVTDRPETDTITQTGSEIDVLQTHESKTKPGTDRVSRTTIGPGEDSSSGEGMTDVPEYNTSTEDFTDIMADTEDDSNSPVWLTIMDSIQLLVLAVGYVANTVTLIALNREGKYFSKVLCELLKHQSLVDSWVLGVAGIVLLQPFMWRTGIQTFDIFVCHFWHSQAPYWGMVFLSVWNLVLISYERYLAVCHPFSHQKLTKGRIRVAILMLYPISFLVTFCGYLQVKFDEEQSRCVNDRYTIPGQLGKDIMYAHAINCFIAFYVIPLICYVAMYGRILYALRRRQKGSQFSASQTIEAASDSMTKTAVTLTVIFILTIGFGLWHYVLAYSNVVEYNINSPVQKIGVFLSVFNSCINPFVYAALIAAYRRCLIRAFSCSVQGTVKTEISTISGSEK